MRTSGLIGLNAPSGPLPQLATTSKCCSAARRTGHQLLLQKIRWPNSHTGLRFQRVAATQASNFSAGVWYRKVFLGRSFSWRTTSLSLA